MSEIADTAGAIGILVYNDVPLGYAYVIPPYKRPGAGFITASSGSRLLKLLRKQRVTVTFDSAAPVGITSPPHNLLPLID